MTAPAAMTSPASRVQPVPCGVALPKAQVKPCPATKVESGTYSRTFTYTNSLGLHARPAALLVKTVSPFKCAITAQHDDHLVNARSILGLLTLAVGPAGQVTFTAQGSDATVALAAIARLFKTRFEEAYGPSSVVQPPAGVAPTV